MKLYIDQKNNVVTMHEASGDMKCFEQFENSKPYTFDTVKEVKGLENPVHILLNTSMIDEKWIYMNLKKYISKQDRVCILPFSFLRILKMRLTGINNMHQDKAYGIVQIKMYSINMVFVMSKLYG